MKKSIRSAAFVCALMMSVTSLSAISVSAAESTKQSTSATQAANGAKQSQNVKFGKVTAVSGSKVTVALGEMKAPQNDNGNPPEKPAGGDFKPDGNFDPSSMPAGGDFKPDGNFDPSSMPAGADFKPDGNFDPSSMPAGGDFGKMPVGEFTESGKKTKITVSKSITVKKNRKTASVSDIKKGDILMLVYNDSNKLTGIEIMDANCGDTAKSTGKNTNTTTAKTKNTNPQKS